ncbi:hypothetical protein K7432_004873 [Basidiobolus ranarum]|uniref:Uncharacterized protein n=1 Tax=Basidiobolus ranarum TaxID=34480 RepID=A0ABR2W3X8_9FUNG
MRFLRRLVFLISLIYFDEIQGKPQGGIEKGRVLGKQGAPTPTVTVVSTYTELETTSIMFTSIHDSHPTSVDNVTDHAEETGESSSKEEYFESENPDEKEKEATWDNDKNNDKKMVDPPNQPLPVPSPTTSTLHVTASPTGTKMGFTPGPTTSSSPTYRPTVTQSFNPFSSRKSGSSQSSNTFPTSKPSPQPGHRSIGAVNGLNGYWAMLGFIIVFNSF